ncbi:hypothetical protein GCM10009854_06640 [Saccharopolyspora halophila]|uniref:Uncharacterized protein n=1 Tax=Saccharopolyspora halophila TaxID=405551 RepID=A0ABN3FNS5_9PSEU
MGLASGSSAAVSSADVPSRAAVRKGIEDLASGVGTVICGDLPRSEYAAVPVISPVADDRGRPSAMDQHRRAGGQVRSRVLGALGIGDGVTGRKRT